MTTNKMDPFQTGKKKKSDPKYQNFLEAYKDINAVRTHTGNNLNYEEFLNQQENRIRQQERFRWETVRREEQVIYSREKQQEKLEIETLQVKIKELAKEVGGTLIEAEKTAFQAVINPGTYHKNFFRRLLQLIELARKKVVESRSWLQLHNHRSQCKSAYWSGVKKGGTSFMLSSDRTVATQAG